MKSLFLLCLLLAISQSLAKQVPAGKQVKQRKSDDLKPVQQELDLAYLPINTVAEVGSEAILTCGVVNSAVSHSVQWYEYAYSPTGGLISDNGFVLGHPQAGRYFIINDVPGHYNLRISDVRLSDGGTYMCIDTQTSASNKRQHSAFLTIVEARPNCTTSIKANGVVLDKSYQTNDCLLDYQGGLIPNISWSGISPFDQAYVATTHNVWSGMQFNVTRNMDTRAHVAQTYFTNYFLPVDANTASNVPTYTKTHQGNQMFVYWGPVDIAATPIKEHYEPGDFITCTADAFPNATFNWANMRTLDVIPGPVIRIEEAWRGFNQTLRCEARNEIEGTTYAANLFIAADVPALTTPPTTTTATTTTPPPAVSDCTDLTGSWESVNPTSAALCIRLNLESYGLLTGLLRNHTDTYWVDIVGRAQSTRFDQVGFNGIWPFEIGVSSFIGECHRCFGEEQLLVNVISRSEGNTCGVAGPTQYTSQYLFTRSNNVKCPNLPIVI